MERHRLHIYSLIILVLSVVIGLFLLNYAPKPWTIFTPIVMLIFIALVNLRFSSVGMVLLRILASVPFYFFGYVWFMTFVFTEYRSSHKIWAIPLSIGMLCVGSLIANKTLPRSNANKANH